MKKIMTYLMLFACMATAVSCKVSPVATSQNAPKLAKDESKKRDKEGWETFPGDMPMRAQFEKHYAKTLQEDDKGFPMFMHTTAQVRGTSYNAAVKAATNAAKVELAGLISTKVAEVIKQTMANEQMNLQEALSTEKMIALSKSLIQQEIGQVLITSKLLKKADDDEQVDVVITVVYSQDMAREAARKAARKLLEKEAEELGPEVDKALNDMVYN